MKRRAQIAKDLAVLRAQSHPGDWDAELRKIVIRSAGHEPYLRRLLSELEDQYGGAFERATQQPKRSKNRWRDASRLASWLEEEKRGVKKTAWTVKARIDKKTLRDLLNKYHTDAAFKVAVEEIRATLVLVSGTIR
jgi:hypothetical protein